jgi:tetrahydromethanopterin S-methyltransferase subunit F
MPLAKRCKYERGFTMDSTMIIRIAAGVLFVIVLVVLIQRRRTSVK